MDEGGSVWGFPRGLRLKEERWELRLRRNVSIKDGLKSRKDFGIPKPTERAHNDAWRASTTGRHRGCSRDRRNFHSLHAVLGVARRLPNCDGE